MLSQKKLVAAMALFVGAIAARADDTKSSEQPFDDAKFVAMAASDGMHEVELGKIGASQAKSAEVKMFAEKMVKDHTKANEGLKAAAKAAGIPVPEKLDEKHQKHIDMFKGYKGDHFDADFMKHMVTDHTEAVALFTRASKEAKNKELKEFAARTLTTIQEHLEMAKKLSK